MFIMDKLVRSAQLSDQRNRKSTWVFVTLYLVGFVIVYEVIEQTANIDIPQVIVDAAERSNSVSLSIAAAALALAGGSTIAILPRYFEYRRRQNAVSVDLRVSVAGLLSVTAAGAVSLGVRLLMTVSEGLPVRLRALVALFELVWLLLVVDGLFCSVKWNVAAYSEMSSDETSDDDEG